MGKIKQKLSLDKNDYKYLNSNCLTININKTGFQKIINLAAQTENFDRHQRHYSGGDSRIKAALRAVNIPIHRYPGCDIQFYADEGYKFTFDDNFLAKKFFKHELEKDHDVEWNEVFSQVKITAQEFILKLTQKFNTKDAIRNDLKNEDINEDIIVNYVTYKLQKEKNIILDQHQVRIILNNNRDYFLTYGALKEVVLEVLETNGNYDFNSIKNEMKGGSNFSFGKAVFLKIQETYKKEFETAYPNKRPFIKNEYIESWMKEAIYSFFASEDGLDFLKNKSNKDQQIKPEILSEAKRSQSDENDEEEQTLDIDENSTALGKLRDVWIAMQEHVVEEEMEEMENIEEDLDDFVNSELTSKLTRNEENEEGLGIQVDDNEEDEIIKILKVALLPKSARDNVRELAIMYASQNNWQINGQIQTLDSTNTQYLDGLITYIQQALQAQRKDRTDFLRVVDHPIAKPLFVKWLKKMLEDAAPLLNNANHYDPADLQLCPYSNQYQMIGGVSGEFFSVLASQVFPKYSNRQKGTSSQNLGKHDDEAIKLLCQYTLAHMSSSCNQTNGNDDANNTMKQKLDVDNDVTSKPHEKAFQAEYNQEGLPDAENHVLSIEENIHTFSYVPSNQSVKPNKLEGENAEITSNLQLNNCSDDFDKYQIDMDISDEESDFFNIPTPTSR